MGGPTPPNPAEPRAPHDIRGWGAHRAQAPAEEGGGRGPSRAAPESAPPPRALSLRPAPLAPHCPRRASGSQSAPLAPQRAPPAAAQPSPAQPSLPPPPSPPPPPPPPPPPDTQPQARARTQLGRQGRAQLALPPPAPAPPAASPRPPPLPSLLLRFSSSFPGPGCQHHVRRGRFWEPTEKIQVGVPGGAER